MEKPICQEQPPLKCPRCDSSNTKFCYYNNYSLSQPRHFCKACKRYWTRGGTLRNVPVGGGCRKNKRIRRSSAVDLIPSSPPTPPPPPPASSAVDLTKTRINNPLFYGLPICPSNPNPPFPRLLGSRVSGFESFLSGYDHGKNNGFVNSSSSTSNPLLSSYPVFRSSLISGGLIKNSTKLERGTSNFPGMIPFEDLQTSAGNALENGVMLKDYSVSLNHQNNYDQTEEIMVNNNNVNYSSSSTSDPSLLFPWNNGGWMDPSSLGSSLPSLI